MSYSYMSCIDFDLAGPSDKGTYNEGLQTEGGGNRGGWRGEGDGGRRTRLCRKPLPQEVCFNADRVPVEAVMLICPLVKYCSTPAVEEGKRTMKTCSSEPRRAEGGRREGGEPWKLTGSKHSVFLSLQCQCCCTPAHSDPSKGGYILFSEWIASASITPTHTHTHT